MDYLYWKNTKESVRDEYKIPPLVEDLNLLDFTGIFIIFIYILVVIFIYYNYIIILF
jgi:hypothetical protein